MKKKILVTTTNSVENAEILKYIDLISVNVVVGTNFFSDFGASLTDLFGGYSDTYQNKLQGIYKDAVDKLQQRAVSVGANAIVGLKIDFDEISGKGKSMFMISALGMAVLLRYDDKNNNAALDESKVDVVEVEDLENELLKIKIKRALTQGMLPDNDQWLYLLNNSNDELTRLLFIRYLEVSEYPNNELNAKQLLLKNNIALYFAVSDKMLVAELLYSKICQKFQLIYPLLEGLKLFSARHIQELITSDHLDEAIPCLSIQKSDYSTGDLIDMGQIVVQLSNLPDKGKVDILKGLLSKAKEKYICLNGHNNDTTIEYCGNCGRNIKGITRGQVDAVASFKEKVDTLSLLFAR